MMKFTTSKSLVATTAVLSFIGRASALCYLPNGTVNADPTVKACGAVQYSACCLADEECLPNGLCAKGGYYYREYCTDPTWQTDKCAKLCLDTPDQWYLGTILTLCDDGSFCCGFKSDSCCQKNEGKFIDAKGQIVIKTTSRLPAPTSTSSPSSSSSTTFTDPASSTSGTNPTATNAGSSKDDELNKVTTVSPGLSAGAKAGIAVGAVFGALALLLLAWFLYRRRTTGRPASVDPQAYPPPMADTYPPGGIGHTQYPPAPGTITSHGSGNVPQEDVVKYFPGGNAEYYGAAANGQAQYSPPGHQGPPYVPVSQVSEAPGSYGYASAGGVPVSGSAEMEGQAVPVEKYGYPTRGQEVGELVGSSGHGSAGPRS